MFNKRGQDLSVGTLVLIIIGVVVLVLVVLGFTMGWDNLISKINIFGPSNSDLSAKIQSCELAVTTQAIPTFCTFSDRPISLDGQQRYINCEYSKVRSNLKSGSLSCTVDYNNGACTLALKNLAKDYAGCVALKSLPVVNDGQCSTSFCAQAFTS